MKNSIDKDKQLNLFTDQSEKNTTKTNLSLINQNNFNKNNVISFDEFKKQAEFDLRKKLFSLSDHLD